MTDVRAAMKDAESLLNDSVDMKEHLAALQRVDPVLAREIGQTWDKTTRVLQRIVYRGLASKMILNGQYDQAAAQIVEGAGSEALLRLISGEAKMSDTLKRALNNLDGPRL